MENMTPLKPITEGQIGKINDLFSAKLRKRDFKNPLTQYVIEKQGNTLVEKLLHCFEKFLNSFKQVSLLIDRSRSVYEVLQSGGFPADRTSKVFIGERKNDIEEVDIIFFKVGSYLKDDELAREYEQRGLYPVDLHTLAAFNEANTIDILEKNVTHWKDSEGKWCCACFQPLNGDRNWTRINYSYTDGYSDFYWFAGFIKK